jgi:spore coat protein H
MLKDVPRVLVAALVCLSLLACPMSLVAAETPVKDASDDVFGLTRVWKIHLHVTAANWKTMQPVGGGFPNFGPPPPGSIPGGGPPGPAGPPAAGGDRPRVEPGRKPGDPPSAGPGPNQAGPGRPPAPFRPGSFGFDFEYVGADIELDGETFRNVGLRFKGNGSYMLSASRRKRPFKIDFDRFVDDQKFHGMQQINLHSNVMDPTHLRQALSYPVFAAAGIASPRTAFAEVTLTIDGECDHEFLGLYTLVEEVDKSFLRRHFQTTKGLLFKPEGTQGLEYKGEDRESYAWFEPKSKPKKSESRRLIETLRLIHKADDKQFQQEIGTYLDTDEFARFLAANTLLANLDSFLTHVHNYYLYLSPESNRFVLLPWDMDLSMGAFFFAGSAEQLQDLSISHPHVGENRLLDRLLTWDEFNRIYREHLRQLTETCFGEQGLTTKSLPVARAAIQDLVDRDAKQVAAARAARGPGGPGGFGGFGGGPGGPGMSGSAASIDTFLVKRRESITAQLNGSSKGRPPSMGFGPVGPPGGGGFGPGNFHAPPILLAADTDKDQKITREELLALGTRWFDEWDQDKNESLSPAEITTGLNKALGPPPNAPAGGFKPPAGFGPGTFLGPPLHKASDADKDGATSRDEWNTRFGQWFTEWDTTKDQRLDNAELIAGLNKVFGPPPGFGGPGGGPPVAPSNPPRGASDSKPDP